VPLTRQLVLRQLAVCVRELVDSTNFADLVDSFLHDRRTTDNHMKAAALIQRPLRFHLVELCSQRVYSVASRDTFHGETFVMWIKLSIQPVHQHTHVRPTSTASK